ncbi:hypothetical protein WMY93_032012 [Mugilogobius chulae]|uniref:Uncharacterized protein n=1 Tax=Mugilogobius chulae TaxID=88201 RepID=A0AAW0ML42_9GOBI
MYTLEIHTRGTRSNYTREVRARTTHARYALEIHTRGTRSNYTREKEREKQEERKRERSRRRERERGAGGQEQEERKRERSRRTERERGCLIVSRTVCLQTNASRQHNCSTTEPSFFSSSLTFIDASGLCYLNDRILKFDSSAKADGNEFKLNYT